MFPGTNYNQIMQSAVSSFPVTETISPPLKDIIEVLNHESMNLYAEHLLKELGRVFEDSGSTESGIKVVKKFLFRPESIYKGCSLRMAADSHL